VADGARATWLLAALVVALEIPYPLVHGQARDVLTVATVLTFATASVVHALHTDGVRAAAALVGVAGVGGLAVEMLGVHTGLPFGDYRYTGGLGPSVAAVPVVIGAAWVMMTRPAMAVAATLAGGYAGRVAIAAVALASWDVFLDPQMVDARHWRWSRPTPHLPGVADVPLSNFGGWLLVALVLMAILMAVAPARPARGERPMLALWLWTWVSSALAAAVFFGRPAVAAWGAVAMGTVGVPLVQRMAAR
jgi:putative membrane protein